MEKWVVYYYHDLDKFFGYDPGPRTIIHGLEPSVAKSIAKHYRKVADEFEHYWAEEASRRYW
ncbi:MAG: hypothetical protein IJH55_09340 [Romboutsia sp.]|nr:hypothetical protein [Romboutsia sp.]